MKMKTNLGLINSLILQKGNSLENIGLLNGKMGVCIYLFHLHRETGNSTYKEKAGSLLEDIWQKTERNIVPMDFENGLAGIGWGIEYLVKEDFVPADTDDVLNELDDKIYQYLVNHKEFSLGLSNGLLGFGFYLLSRLKGKRSLALDTRNYLLERLLMGLINRIYDAVEEREEDFKEPILFQSNWILPLWLILLSETKKLGIYDKKIGITLNRISPIIRSIFPILHSHRLYLLIAVKEVQKVWSSPFLEKHADILQDSIDPDEILTEFSDKSVNLELGMSGIMLIESAYTGQCHFTKCLLKRMERSTFWNSLQNEGGTPNVDLSLMHGLTGISMNYLLSDLKSDIKAI